MSALAQPACDRILHCPSAAQTNWRTAPGPRWNRIVRPDRHANRTQAQPASSRHPHAGAGASDKDSVMTDANSSAPACRRLDGGTSRAMGGDELREARELRLRRRGIAEEVVDQLRIGQLQ